jgi:hypothetical protein
MAFIAAGMWLCFLCHFANDTRYLYAGTTLIMFGLMGLIAP